MIIQNIFPNRNDCIECIVGFDVNLKLKVDYTLQDVPITVCT